jgi:nucleoside-diphosphate-sugar epimerase
MTVVVTGAAGFIGSHLCEALLERGERVVGIDAITPYYDVQEKLGNLADLCRDPRFEFLELDLRTDDLTEVLAGADVVWHQAGQPGVRLSWSDGFGEYVTCNVLATQRLLEAAKAVGCQRFVYASSSSVYGNAARYPTFEDQLCQPYSPYGVTKMAAEHLCTLYAKNWGLSTVSLRYFTVYGPRQRPDMAFRRLLESAVGGHPFELYGSGHQIRDFTYVADIVRANLLAGIADVPPGTVVNISGGASVSMLDALAIVNDLVGGVLDVRAAASQPGDVERTGGDSALAAALLGWEPQVPIAEGLALELAWCRARYETVSQESLTHVLRSA